ncbi:uncharacterized protein B0H18DRAFT_871848 [Fomitopsis serialis]|uniref:uncharacterized protein n=1 Tax=Fomitopsis serialis TaxID=139415 RepID=UPI002008C6E0|nr:uncharacterized protein B0H18DRAFT_871848 [Neoantrodia serialis]KAH9931877.1 hypothetical protein B0H18DRAFT_871848 [Neoantrodia serialis]
MDILIPEPGSRAPLYDRFREYEMELSELTGDPPEAKYLFFANHVHGAGWGNIMQELLLHAYTAYRSNRTFVWYDNGWNTDGTKYTFYDGKRIPSRIHYQPSYKVWPLVGAQPRSNPSATRPFGISEDYFNVICPSHSRRKVAADQIFALIGHEPTAASVVDKMIDVVGAMPDKCVEVPKPSRNLFDVFIFGDGRRLLDVWPAYSKSPILQEFFWSSLVELAFDTNRETFSPTSPSATTLGSTPLYPYSSDVSPSAQRYTPLPGLLALHVRRGDFAEHCIHLAKWRSTYVGFNSFPELPDRFEYLPNTSEQERIQLYRPHCYVEVLDIVRRVQEIREAERAAGRDELRDVFLMTNAPQEWIAEVKVALNAMRGPAWRSISSSRDLIVNREQQYVKQAVDMLIGQRAQVFLGNGFSSLSGAVTMFRMANGISPGQCRLF